MGVDRVDYTKGIIERFRGVERFLEGCPAYRGKFTFVQIGAPSRTNIPRYHDFLVEVEAEAERINARFKDGNWRPIVLLNAHHSHEEICPITGRRDLCMVTSLHDGMNLVAKEFVASREDERGGADTESIYRGCARTARCANRQSIRHRSGRGRHSVALEMDPDECAARMRRMRRSVKEHNIYWWAANLIGGLCELRLDYKSEKPVAVEHAMVGPSYGSGRVA